MAILEAEGQCSHRRCHSLLELLGDSHGFGCPANGWPWRQHNLDDEEEAYPPYREGMQPYHVAGLVEERCS